jgi:hypothetical protein
MNMRDLIPWNRGRELSTRRGEDINPFLTLHREMNRLFDDVFRGFDVTPLGSDRGLDRALACQSASKLTPYRRATLTPLGAYWEQAAIERASNSAVASERLAVVRPGF